ncbi:MAG: hypothetical protein ACRC8Q_12130 [Aeromonas sp.]
MPTSSKTNGPQTDGLTEKQFIKLFNAEQKRNAVARRSAKNTLTPGRLSRKSVEDLVRAGKNKDGSQFTAAQFKAFKATRDQFKKTSSGAAGISYAELTAKSLSNRVDRASGRDKDGRAVRKGQLMALKANVVIIKVTASDISDRQSHKVEIRLEEWDDKMAAADGTDRGYSLAAKKSCAGRLSIDCTCGDHQYRYRYMATLGNYGLPPPKEFAFPKVTNPLLKGLACKHVLLAATMLQSPTWSLRLGKEMAKQAHRIGYGDDKKTTQVFSGDDAKALAKNKKKTINHDQAKLAYKRYLDRQQSASKRLAGGDEEIAKLRAKLKVARKTNTTAAEKLRKAKQENEALKKQARELTRNKVKLQFQSFADAFAVAGLSRDAAIAAFSDKHKIPQSTLKGLIK